MSSADGATAEWPVENRLLHRISAAVVYIIPLIGTISLRDIMAAHARGAILLLS
jgi:hypothetical protein